MIKTRTQVCLYQKSFRLPQRDLEDTESSLHENSGPSDSVFVNQSEMTVLLAVLLLVAAEIMKGGFCLAYHISVDP